jgi:hypothetical protein
MVESIYQRHIVYDGGAPAVPAAPPGGGDAVARVCTDFPVRTGRI